MSHEGHTRFLEQVQESLSHIPGLDGMRDDLKDDLLEHVLSNCEGVEKEICWTRKTYLRLVIEWFVQKTADSMSGADLDKMAKEYQAMPDHYKYLVK